MIRAWSSIRAGIDALTSRFPLLIGAWLIILAAQQAIAIVTPEVGFWPLVESLLVAVLVTPLYAGQHLIALKVIREESVSIRDLFRGYSRWGTLIGISILTGLAIAMGTLLLVVPGIVWGLMLVFAPISALDARDPDGTPRKLGTFDALQESQEVTKGYKGVLFRIALALALPSIAIGVLLAIKMRVPSFPVPFWTLELLAILSGTLFLGPLGATTNMTVYHQITSLRREAYETDPDIPSNGSPENEQTPEAQTEERWAGTETETDSPANPRDSAPPPL